MSVSLDSMAYQAPISVVGMGSDGCLSLTSRAMNQVACAEVLIGTAAQLAFFPQFVGEKISYRFPLEAFLQEIFAQYQSQDICILTSGDPLFYGLGQTLTALKLTRDIEYFPSVTCVQLACARFGLPWVEMALLSLHGEVNKARLAGLIVRLQQHDQLALLTDSIDHPVAIAQKMVRYQELGWQLYLAEALGSPQEKLSQWTPASLAAQEASQIHATNVLLMVRTTQIAWENGRGHQADSAYAKRTPLNGLITKAPIRALAVANLQLSAKSIMWDIGAGSGSIGVEAAKIAYQARCYAIECHPDCWPMIEENIIAHKVDNLQLIREKAPQGLAQLPDPDAIFCGGTRGALQQLVPYLWQRLNKGGRLIFSAVTLDTLCELKQVCEALALQPQILLVQAASDKPIAHYTSYQGMNPIHLFILSKP